MPSKVKAFVWKMVLGIGKNTNEGQSVQEENHTRGKFVKLCVL